MRARPNLRNSLLLGMASFASRLPEDYPEVQFFLMLDAMVPPYHKGAERDREAHAKCLHVGGNGLAAFRLSRNDQNT